MESKHFSHHHPLTFHHLPQPSHHRCSACKSPAFGNIYACWQCCYFLHEQCFRATRSLKHPSHPLHPLTLVPFPTYPSSTFFCNSCNLAGDAFSYTCSACEFDLHLHCALNPNPNPTSNPIPNTNPLYPPRNPNPHQSSFPIPHNPIYPLPNPNYNPNQHYPPPPTANLTPQNHPPPPNPAAADPPPPPEATIKHFTHPHALKQAQIEKTKPKLCSACERELSGAAYSCTEPHCTFNLHKPCFDLLPELRHSSHPHHDLTLHTTPSNITCNACRKSGKGFAYTCGTCSFNLHVHCIQWPEILTRPDHKHPLKVFYSSPYAGPAAVFVCSVCMRVAEKDEWVYYCGKCDFGTHLECVRDEVKKEFSPEEAAAIEEEVSKLVGQKVRLEDLLEMAREKEEEEKEDEAYLRKMEMEEELRRKRHNFTMQQAADSVNFMGGIG